MIHIIIFSILMAIKGGSHWRYVPSGWSGKNKVADWFLDGTQLSSFIAGIWAGVFIDPLTGFLFGIAWWVGNMASLGEEVGAIGRLGKSWGPYLDWLGKDGVEYGWKKGLQRGIYLGAMLALATGNTALIVAGAALPPVYWVGQTLHWKIKNTDSWAWAEPIYGALIGAAFAMGV